MTTGTIPNPFPDIAPPPGFDIPDEWTPGPVWSKDEARPWRLVYDRRPVSGHDAYVELRAVQFADGSVADFELYVLTGDADLNSSQARELAALLVSTAAELDWWVAK